MLKWLFESVKYPSKNAEVLHLLGEHLEELCEVTDSQECNLLHVAADYNPELLPDLLSLYLKLDQAEHPLKDYLLQADLQGNTPLHYAVFRGHYETVQLLLSYGANLKEVNHHGLNCMHLAAQAGSPALIVLTALSAVLLQKGGTQCRQQGPPREHASSLGCLRGHRTVCGCPLASCLEP